MFIAELEGLSSSRGILWPEIKTDKDYSRLFSKTLLKFVNFQNPRVKSNIWNVNRLNGLRDVNLDDIDEQWSVFGTSAIVQ